MRRRVVLLLVSLLAVAATGLVAAGEERPAAAQSSDYLGFRVVGRHLYDRFGEKVVLYGVNKMVIWTDLRGATFPEIAQTGANAVRIVWLTSGAPGQLDTVISNSIANQMIPVVDCHDTTGDWSRLADCVDYWVRPDIVQVLKKHEAYLLINIANEPVESYILDTKYRAGFELAIKRMRAAGIRVPLIIDAQGFGQSIDSLQRNAPYLIEADPEHNLIFSIHIYWSTKTHGINVDQMVIDEFRESVEMEMPLIVGEFANMGWQCACCIPYQTIIEQCHLNEIGYFAWSWGPGNRDCREMDMTDDGRFETLHGWGLEVAVTDPHSIQNIAVRPAWIADAAPAAEEPLPPASEGPLPDLVVTDISWSPDPAVKKDDILFSATIENRGKGATPEGVTHRCLFQVNGATVSWSDVYTASIAPGESVTLVASSGPDGDAWWNQANIGNFVAFAWVDDQGSEWYNAIEESDEHNNMLTAPGTVWVEPPPTPAPTETPSPSRTPSPTKTPAPTSAPTDTPTPVGTQIPAETAFPPETPSPAGEAGAGTDQGQAMWLWIGVAVLIIVLGIFVPFVVLRLRWRGSGDDV